MATVFAYADDIAIVCQTNRVNKILCEIKSWCKANNLHVNPSKSGIMRILKRSSTKKICENNVFGIKEVS